MELIGLVRTYAIVAVPVLSTGTPDPHLKRGPS